MLLMDLYSDLIYEIFQFLPAEYTFLCQRVNKELQQILNSEEFFESLKNILDTKNEKIIPKALHPKLPLKKKIQTCSLAHSKKCVGCFKGFKNDYPSSTKLFWHPFFCFKCRSSSSNLILLADLEKFDYFIDEKDLFEISHFGSYCWKEELDLLPNSETRKIKKIQQIKKKLHRIKSNFQFQAQVDIKEKKVDEDEFILGRYTRTIFPNASKIKSEIDPEALKMHEREMNLKNGFNYDKLPLSFNIEDCIKYEYSSTFVLDKVGKFIEVYSNHHSKKTKKKMISTASSDAQKEFLHKYIDSIAGNLKEMCLLAVKNLRDNDFHCMIDPIFMSDVPFNDDISDDEMEDFEDKDDQDFHTNVDIKVESAYSLRKRKLSQENEKTEKRRKIEDSEDSEE
eukprot:gene7322-11641_t